MAFSYSNNNLSKYNFNLGDTTANNHKNIDRIATFSGGTWINKNYNADFGGQWCFVDSFLIDDNGPYAIQRIMSAQTNTVLATRYCEKNVWGDWNIGVTKSDLVGHTIYVAGDGGTQNFNIGDKGSFLFIPYTSTTFGIYYLGTDSAKLILGTEDSDFKVSISGSTCMLQNNKGWNIFCVFIAGQ